MGEAAVSYPTACPRRQNKIFLFSGPEDQPPKISMQHEILTTVVVSVTEVVDELIQLFSDMYNVLTGEYYIVV